MYEILFSGVAGICGAGIGGVLAVLLLKRSAENTTCWMLSFAAGIMTSVVCFGLTPEAVELSNIAVAVLGIALGVLIIMPLNRVVDNIALSKSTNLNIHETHEELYHEGSLIHERERAKLLKSGIIMFIAIGLHSFPEGLAIGAGGRHKFQLGLILAIMLALHNIPEGMAIAAPMLAGGIRKRSVILLTALSGAPTLLGGAIGALVGGISDMAIALCLSIAGGAMLYVVFGEIIPQSIILVKSRTATIITLLGILIGFIIAQV